MTGFRRLLADLKDYLKLRFVYPRRYPGAKVESLVPAGLAVHADTIVRHHVHLSPALTELGRGVYLGPFASVHECSRIGPWSSISWGVRLGLSDHPLDHLGTSLLFSRKIRGWVEADTHDPIAEGLTEIGADVLISAGALVLTGVRIGHGAVVGAGAVVKEDVPPYAIVAGVPARVIGHRFDEETREALLASKWWELDPAKLREHRDLFPHPRRFLAAIT